MNRMALRKACGLLSAFAITVASPAGAQQASRAVEVRLASGFWSNLHEFMLILASAKVGNGPTGRVPVQDAQRDTAAYEFLSEEERRAWTAAIEFYMDSLARTPAWNEPALLNEALWRANSADELPAAG
jgi:hypothetical protein